MGYYSEYLNSLKNYDAIVKERKKQLKRIAELRGNKNIFTIASDYMQTKAPVNIDFSDLLPIADQIDNLTGDEIDIILETPGGSGEVAEDIVRLIRNKFSKVGFIIPGWCKSAGTIIALSGDEILMDELSALGPIDAQIYREGKVFSAHAFLEGLEKIKKEVEETGVLNKAYIPILQGISPGEIEHCENSLKFARILVSSWLKNYKFAKWEIHSSTGETVSEEEKAIRSEEIAKDLCNHSKWLTHGRSIKYDDLHEMRVKITDLNDHLELKEAVRRYYIVLRMSFDANLYKIFETTNSQIYRLLTPKTSPINKDAKNAKIDIKCPKCNNEILIQASFKKDDKIEEGKVKFPKNDIIKCNSCGNEINLKDLRMQIEAQTGKKIV